MWTWESTDSDDPSGQRYRYREGTTLFGPVSEHTYLILRAKEPWKWKPLSHIRLFKPYGLYSPWNFPGQNTGVSSLSLLQGIFPTQGLNPGFPHCRQILSPAEPQGKPKNTGVVADPFSRGSSRPRNWTRVSCITGEFFTNWGTEEAPKEL